MMSKRKWEADQRAGRPDPLAGKRAAINAGELDALLWSDDGNGCPVAVGDVFRLRSCHIEITRVHRVTAKGSWSWRAEFRRQLHEARLYLLTRGAGDGHGYATDPARALRAQDDPNAATLDQIAADDRSTAHRDLGDPPEPEAVAPHEVATLPRTVAAQIRWRQVHDEEVERRLDRSMSSKLREVRIRARQAGVDVSEEMDAIEQATERARLKIREAA